MTFDEIIRELTLLMPDRLEESEDKELKELKKMAMPRNFYRLYEDKSPIESIAIGHFNFLRLQDLINENIWDSPGEDLYELGFPIVGSSPEGQFYCINLTEKNKNNENDLLLVDSDEDYSGMTAKEARKIMKFMNGSFEAFLTKEFEFLKKSLRKKG